ncbi:hypothetical protein C8R45DRAFT_1176257 [Mycena sanguinolenta]|nr:hypothetical protein C8R45DRAFT_1176257 [Mycena sanguinolenta]
MPWHLRFFATVLSRVLCHCAQFALGATSSFTPRDRCLCLLLPILPPSAIYSSSSSAPAFCSLLLRLHSHPRLCSRLRAPPRIHLDRRLLPITEMTKDSFPPSPLAPDYFSVSIPRGASSDRAARSVVLQLSHPAHLLPPRNLPAAPLTPLFLACAFMLRLPCASWSFPPFLPPPQARYPSHLADTSFQSPSSSSWSSSTTLSRYPLPPHTLALSFPPPRGLNVSSHPIPSLLLEKQRSYRLPRGADAGAFSAADVLVSGTAPFAWAAWTGQRAPLGHCQLCCALLPPSGPHSSPSPSPASNSFPSLPSRRPSPSIDAVPPSSCHRCIAAAMQTASLASTAPSRPLTSSFYPISSHLTLPRCPLFQIDTFVCPFTHLFPFWASLFGTYSIVTGRFFLVDGDLFYWRLLRHVLDLPLCALEPGCGPSTTRLTAAWCWRPDDAVSER